MVTSAVNILKTYPACDIYRKSDNVLVRKQVKAEEVTEGLIKDYLNLHGDLFIIPKKMVGASPMAVREEALIISKASVFPQAQNGFQGLSGFEGQQMPGMGGGNDIYKILYDRERSESQDWKRKYEDTLTELRKLEVESAGNKNSTGDKLLTTLGSLGPALLGMTGGGGSLGGTQQPQQQQPQQQGQLQPISDKRLTTIVSFWAKMDEATKDNAYNLIAALIDNPSPEAVQRALNGFEEESNYPI